MILQNKLSLCTGQLNLALPFTSPYLTQDINRQNISCKLLQKLKNGARHRTDLVFATDCKVLESVKICRWISDFRRKLKNYFVAMPNLEASVSLLNRYNDRPHFLLRWCFSTRTQVQIL
jgi:hypothetical protein